MPWHSSYDEAPIRMSYEDDTEPVPTRITSHHTYRHPGQAAVAHELYVAHVPAENTFRVRLGHTDSAGQRHSVTLDGDHTGARIRGATASIPVNPPSEALQALIAGHHETEAWMPLVDKLAEEYPEHFDGPAQHHTAARALP